MHRLTTLGLLAFCLVATIGCSVFRGALYTNVTEPGLNYPQGNGLYYGSTPGIARYELDNEAGPGSKTGTAEVHNWFYLVAYGDASVATAAKDGGITTIHTIDGHVETIWFFWSCFVTTVTGE